MRRHLLPVVALQAAWTRATLTLAAPAAGPATGRAGEGAGPPLRLGVVGDSTAAGCGVPTHEDGFAAWLARELAERTGAPVTWETVGRLGATSRRIRHRLVPRLGTGLDVAVLLGGANDVLTRRGPEQWAENLGAMIADLADRAERVVVVGIPPLATLPALPAVLRRYLGLQAARMDEVARGVCAARPSTTWVDSSDVPPPGFFSHDGFHPSSRGYRRWASAVADHLAARPNPRVPTQPGAVDAG